MKTYKACFFVSKNAEYRAFLNFIKDQQLNIQTKASTSFSPEEAASADIIFVDEKTANQQCVALEGIKKANRCFLPVLLLTSEKTNTGKSLPSCIDDVVFIPFSKTVWKRRLATYLHLREKEINIFSSEESEFIGLFTESHSIMLLLDPETGKIENANRAACRFYGYTYNEITGMRIQQINVLREGQVNRELAKAGSNKKNYFVFEHRLADGSIKTVEVYSGKVNHKGKQLLYSIIHDITGKKKTEKLLRESEERYRSVFKTSSGILAITEFSTGKYIEINDSFVEILGYTREELLGKTSLELKIWVDTGERKKMIDTLRKEGFIKDMETRLRHKDGRIIFGLLSAQLISLQGKEYIVSEIRDITHFKQAEKALIESRQLFETLAKISPIGIFKTDAKGKTTYVNPQWTKITGISFERSTKKGWADILPPNEKEELLARWTDNMAAKTISKEKLGIVRPDGTVRWILGHAIPEIIDGKFAGYVGTITDITELVNVEQALRESENKYRSLAETSTDLILTFDINGKLTYLSPAVQRITGYPVDEVLHKHFWEFILPEYVESTIEKFKRGIGGGYIPLYEIELLYKNGKRVPVEVNSTAFYNTEKKIVGGLAVIRDITDRKKAEKALKESEARLKRFSQITQEGIIIHKNGITIDANQAIFHILGYSADDLVGRNIVKKLACPEYYPIVNKNMKKGYVKPYDIKVFKKDGTILPVEIEATNYTDINGETLRAVVFRDITQRREMEKTLRESERKYKEQSHLFRLMSDNIPDMVWSKDMEGRFTFANKAICEKLLIAKDTEEPIGKSDSYFAERQKRLYPGRKNWYTFDKLCSDSDSLVFNLQKPVRANEFGYVQGKFLYLDVYKAPIFNENNQIIGIVGHSRDITKEKEAEKALLLRDKALNVAANAIIITNADGEIEWVNEAFTKLSGYVEKEVLGKFTIDLIGTGKQDESFYEKIHNILKSGQVWAGEFNDRRKDGTLYEVEEVITPVTDKNGKVEHLIGIMNDISERKIAERELLTAKKAAEESSRLKSAFLANMNHEIRTPMNAIMGFSDLMLEASPEEKVNYAKIVNNSAGQLLHLIDDVIFLSRLQSEKLPVKKIIFSPANLISEIIFMFDLPEIKKGLEFQTRLPENAGSIAMKADADKIRQVLTNFLSNAIKYTEKGYVKLGFEIRNSSILFFEEDSGMGVPKNEQQRIFEAFFRGAKAAGSAIRGTGLGLNIAKELVELMGGTIGVSSRPGKGSRFYFSLPYETPKASFTETPSYKPKLRKWKDLNILIAEDDETNFLYLEIILKEKVNRVDRAINGQEAVEMIRKKSYDLVLMDLKMPVMTGTEATKEIKKQYPHLLVIATTAYATAEEKEHALDAGCDGYLSKPIKRTEIMDIISRHVSGKNKKTG